MSKTTFTRDEANARLAIERVFPAPQGRVWQAMTDPGLLDQWWAPKPWWTKTVHMDFRVGGYWLYSMNGPNGEQHFGRMDYLEIEPEHRFKSDDAFTATSTNRCRVSTSTRASSPKAIAPRSSPSSSTQAPKI